MPKIDISKVVGVSKPSDSEHPLLPVSITSNAPRYKSWRSRIPQPLRSPLVFWSIVVGILFLQIVVIWRFFFYQEPIPTSPPYNVTETVALVTEYYRLLQDMHYLGGDSIAYAPHVGENAINVTLAQNLGLDTQVIDTLNQLPYIVPANNEDSTGVEGYLTNWSKWVHSDHDIFYRNGKFVDYRNDTNLYLSRDPIIRSRMISRSGLSLEEQMLEMEAMPNTAIPLSLIRGRSYGLSLVLETSRNRIIFLDTQGGGNHDEFINNFDYDKIPREYWMPKIEFYGEEPRGARLANDVLKELIVRTAGLESGYLPGGVRSDPHYTPELSPPSWENWMRELYKKKGWPRKDVLRCLYHSIPREKKHQNCSSNPLEKFDRESFEVNMKSLLHNITISYMPDWYCPVPRNESFINKLKYFGKLTKEQIAYAMSDEPVIPFNLVGWGANLVFMQD